MRVLFFTGLMLLAALRCAVFTAPDSSVVTRLELAAASATPGQRLGLTVIAHNGGRAAMITSGCGAGLDVQVRAPSGATTLLISHLPSICPVFDSNVIEPGETDTVRIAWEAPSEVGNYTLRGGVRVEGGLGALSLPATVAVRP